MDLVQAVMRTQTVWTIQGCLGQQPGSVQLQAEGSLVEAGGEKAHLPAPMVQGVQGLDQSLVIA